LSFSENISAFSTFELSFTYNKLDLRIEVD